MSRLLRSRTRQIAAVIAGALLVLAVARLGAGRQDPVGDGVILGQVVDGTSGTPIEGARVMLQENIDNLLRYVLTDEKGRFVFGGLLPGHYQVRASKPGYVSGLSYAGDPRGAGFLRLQVAAAQRVTDVRMPQWKLSAVGGQVEDALGDPLVGVTVQIFEETFAGGHIRLVPGNNAQVTTDDRGVYRFSQLVPGRFTVVVPPSNLQPDNSGLGNGSIDTTMYFDHVASPSRATFLTLGSGEEKQNVDFQVARAMTARVSGRIVGGDATGPLTVRLVSLDGDVQTDLDVATTMSTPSGTFTFAHVPPGRYAIRLWWNPPAPDRPSLGPMRGGGQGYRPIGWLPFASNPPVPPIPSAPALAADMPLAVEGKNIDDLTVVLQPCAHVSGRLVFDGVRPTPSGEDLLASLVFLVPVDGMGGSGFSAGHIDADGRFVTAGTRPGLYKLAFFFPQSIPSSGRWSQASVIVGGRDVTGRAFQLGTSSIADAVVTLTDKADATSLSGTVTDGSGKPQLNASVFIFPADRSLWTEFGTYSSDEQRIQFLDDNGGYRSGSLVPNREYLIAAIAGNVPEAWIAPDVLASIAKVATPVRLGVDEKRTLDLKATTIR